MTAYIPDMTTDDVPFPEACRRLEEAGAAVVGVNCGRGPRTMLPLVKEIKKVCKVSKRTMIVHKKKNTVYIKSDLISRPNSSLFVMLLDYIADSYCVIFLKKNYIYIILHKTVPLGICLPKHGCIFLKALKYIKNN